MRHRDPLLCTMGQVAFYLFHRWEVGVAGVREPTPRFWTRQGWYDSHGMASPCCLIQTLSSISPLATESDSSVTPASPVTPRKRHLGETPTLTAAPAASTETLETVGGDTVKMSSMWRGIPRPRLRREKPALRGRLGRLPMDSLRWVFFCLFFRASLYKLYLLLFLLVYT